MTNTTPKFTNALAEEKSPYLLQHAHNPVNWRPWGDAALREARDQDKPILVSIGYATCHWCHVMERESFENEAVAELMNEHFIPIKVDREERPDVDKVYMEACMALTGQGGWPLNVFLTPELKPFYGGTYFPPQPMHGRPSWSQLLSAVAKAWKNDRDKMEENAEGLSEHLMKAALPEAEGGPLPLKGLSKGLGDFFRNRYDAMHGGFGQAPKFPKAQECIYLLQQARFSGEEDLAKMALKTLQAMADGGIYDQIGGGFARYSTDTQWLVPHFEKMLYDNALLIRAYCAAWQVDGNGQWRRVVEQTVAWLLREMTGAEGGFYSAQDADSEGEEGLFYVWTPDQITDVLGEEDGKLMCQAYGVSPGGNFEGRNILHRNPEALLGLAEDVNCSLEELEDKLLELGTKLREHRDGRIWPLTDDKVLGEWNGLMIGALAVAARVFKRPEWLQAAAKAADFVWVNLRRKDGRLLRRWRQGEARELAVLEDYACLAEGFLDLYESSGRVKWLQRSLDLAEQAETLFLDPDQGGYHQSGADAPVILHRLKDLFDGATPSGNNTLAEVQLRLYGITGKQVWLERFQKQVEFSASALTRASHGMVKLMTALNREAHGLMQVVASPAAGESFWAGPLGRLLAETHLPEAAFCLLPEEPGDREALLGLLELNKDLDTGAAAQVQICARQTCFPPMSDEKSLQDFLNKGVGSS